jgi:hypothetical protein
MNLARSTGSQYHFTAAIPTSKFIDHDTAPFLRSSPPTQFYRFMIAVDSTPISLYH